MDAIYTVRRFLVVDWYGEQNTENEQQFEMKRTLVRWVNRNSLIKY